MIVWGIDPGTFESASVGFDGEKLIDPNKQSNQDMLEWLWTVENDQVVIEQVMSYGMAVGKEVFETVFWTGRFFEAVGAFNLDSLVISTPEPMRIGRKAVCGHICNDARAKDGNIRQALIDRLGPPHTMQQEPRYGKNGQRLKDALVKVPGPTFGVTADMWSAAAIAVTVWDQLNGGQR